MSGKQVFLGRQLSSASADVYPYRIFLIYSHGDRALASQIDGLLQEWGAIPLWDRHIMPGTPFPDEIKRLMAKAHIVMPIITNDSKNRAWVQQEIGYALALQIPVVPVTVGCDSSEFLAQVQAMTVREDLSDFHEKLLAARLAKLVATTSSFLPNRLEVVDRPEKRTSLIGQSARELAAAGDYGTIRQKSAFSSFSIHDVDVRDQRWDAKEIDRRSSEFYRELLREERRQLERHVREKGCKLIVDPQFPFNGGEAGETRARLETLWEFLTTVEHSKLQIVTYNRDARDRGNSLLVGDWFCAESRSPGVGGYSETVFDWRAPQVLAALQRFDEQFDELLERKGMNCDQARMAAIDEVNQAMIRLAE